MIGIDTNVLLRAATNDDRKQSPVARKFLAGLSEASRGVINCVVLAEFAWTLRSGYGYERAEILGAINDIMRSKSYLVRDREVVNSALSRCLVESLHFADALIAEMNRDAGCETTLTFDLNAANGGAFTLMAG